MKLKLLSAMCSTINSYLTCIRELDLCSVDTRVSYYVSYMEFISLDGKSKQKKLDRLKHLNLLSFNS